MDTTIILIILLMVGIMVLGMVIGYFLALKDIQKAFDNGRDVERKMRGWGEF